MKNEKAAEKLVAQLAAARQEIGRAIFGQEEVVENALTCLLSGGHALLVGVPGLAKTRLVETLGIVLGLDTRRVQCTPDLMPSDIIGSEILDGDANGRRSFRFLPGPVFSQLLMADEINRASPRTQSALLQAMQEHHVSVSGARHDLPAPFHVLATQNPLEHEGTYPLPEAQLDRFLMEIDVPYPGKDAERRMMIKTTGEREETPRSAMSASDLMEAQDFVRAMPVGEKVVDGILDLVRAGRPTTSPIANVRHHVSWGPGPRACQALMLCARARALASGRLAPSMDDVRALAPAVLRHRMAVTLSARADGITVATIIKDMLDSACA